MEDKNMEVTEEIKVEESVKNNDKKKKKDKHNEEIIVLQEQLAQEIEKGLRIQAEMMNFRRRKEEEVTNYKKYANEDLLKKLLGVVDNFERALSLENEDNQEFLKGFKMIYNSILNIMSEFGVQEIVCLNEDFDPNYHQAVFTEKKEDVDAGKVIEVLQKGYMYKERVLRAAMVKVSK